MDDFKGFSDEAYSLWSAVFESLIGNGMDVTKASEGARDMLMQVLMAYGSMDSVRQHSSSS